MNDYFLLNSRKRAVIALIHAVVFLSIASRGLAGPTQRALFSMERTARTGGYVMLAIYAVVSAVLLYLFYRSRCMRERLYFGFCTSSAMLSIVRTLAGESPLRPAQALKLLMLVCAGGTAMLIWKEHGEAEASESTPEPGGEV